MFVEKQRIQAAIQRWSVGWDADWPDWGGALLLLHQANNTRTHTHTHTHTHTELYNRTELSPVYRELKQLFDKILSTCLPIPHIHIFIAPPHSSTALKINRVRRFPHSSFLLFLHTHTNARAHTHAQESSCLQQETHSTLKERKSPYVSPREQIQS